VLDKLNPFGLAIEIENPPSHTNGSNFPDAFDHAHCYGRNQASIGK